MAFIRKAGKTKTAYWPVTTSTAITKGAIVSLSSGLLIAATSATTNLTHIGVIKKTIASTDSDYATARLVPVEVPVEKNVEWTADFTASLVAGDIGTEADLTDSLTVNRAASAVDCAYIKDVISTTKGVVILKLMGSY